VRGTLEGGAALFGRNPEAYRPGIGGDAGTVRDGPNGCLRTLWPFLTESAAEYRDHKPRTSQPRTASAGLL
jgi:hypothetical protein